jgi:hypothetical protein
MSKISPFVNSRRHMPVPINNLPQIRTAMVNTFQRKSKGNRQAYTYRESNVKVAMNKILISMNQNIEMSQLILSRNTIKIDQEKIQRILLPILSDEHEPRFYFTMWITLFFINLTFLGFFKY